MTLRIEYLVEECAILREPPWWDWETANANLAKRIEAGTGKILHVTFERQGSSFFDAPAWMSAHVLREEIP